MEFGYVRQSTEADWLELLSEKPEAVSQVRIIEERIRKGIPLATWEKNCLSAYEQLTQRQAA